MPNKYKPYLIDQSPLYKLKNRKRLAAIIGIPLPLLENIANSNKNYSEWTIVSKSGKNRDIESPKDPLKRIQSRLAKLLSFISPPSFLFCPVKGRSYVSNAQAHLGSDTIRTIDIKQYFPTTKSQNVFHFFHKRLFCSKDVSAILTKIATFNGRLPTGSPLSPILSFYSHWAMWMDIAQITSAMDCKLTVYVDDITISGATVPDSLIWQIKKCIRRSGLNYHKEKSYTSGKGIVTGIVVNRNKLCLPHGQHLKIFRIRKELKLNINETERSRLLSQLSGRESQMKQVSKLNQLPKV